MDSTNDFISAAAAQDVYMALQQQDKAGDFWTDKSWLDSHMAEDALPMCHPSTPSPPQAKRAWSSLDGAMDVYARPHKMTLPRYSLTEPADTTPSWLAASLLPPPTSSSARLAEAQELQAGSPRHLLKSKSDIMSQPIASLSPMDTILSATSPGGPASYVSQTPELEAADSVLGEADNEGNANAEVAYSPTSSAPPLSAPLAPMTAPVQLYAPAVTTAIAHAVIEAGAKTVDWSVVLTTAIEASKDVQTEEGETIIAADADTIDCTANSMQAHFDAAIKKHLLQVCQKHLGKLVKKPKPKAKKAAPAQRSSKGSFGPKSVKSEAQVDDAQDMPFTPKTLVKEPTLLLPMLEQASPIAVPELAVAKEAAPPPARARGRPSRAGGRKRGKASGRDGAVKAAGMKEAAGSVEGKDLP